MMSSSRAALTTRQEDMQHPTTAFALADYAHTSLEVLHREWMVHLRARIPSVSADTIVKYDDTLMRFIRSLKRHGQPLIMASLTEENVEQWKVDQSDNGNSPHTIISRLAALKAFTGKYLFKRRGYTHYDLLARVMKEMPPDKPREGLTELEREAILNCFSDPGYTEKRDLAFIAMVMATGMRFREVLDLPLSSFDHRHGDIVLVGKGGKLRKASLSDRPLKIIRQYLTLRPKVEADAIWLTEWGTPLTYPGAHCIIRRIRKASGVKRLHWHLLRHGFAQTALIKGADPLMVQEMLGHSSSTMTRKYLGYVRQTEAARLMPQFSPI